VAAGGVGADGRDHDQGVPAVVSGAGRWAVRLRDDHDRREVERNPKTLKMIAFGEDEYPRGLQLYGVDPDVTAKAVRIVVEQNLADHIDLNFGCRS
jgi:hypothetical protein